MPGLRRVDIFNAVNKTLTERRHQWTSVKKLFTTNSGNGRNFDPSGTARSGALLPIMAFISGFSILTSPPTFRVRKLSKRRKKVKKKLKNGNERRRRRRMKRNTVNEEKKCHLFKFAYLLSKSQVALILRIH